MQKFGFCNFLTIVLVCKTIALLLKVIYHTVFNNSYTILPNRINKAKKFVHLFFTEHVDSAFGLTSPSCSLFALSFGYLRRGYPKGVSEDLLLLLLLCKPVEYVLIPFAKQKQKVCGAKQNVFQRHQHYRTYSEHILDISGDLNTLNLTK